VWGAGLRVHPRRTCSGPTTLIRDLILTACSPTPRSPGRIYGVIGIPTISYLPADDVDGGALPAGDLIQHLEDDVDGWRVSAARYDNTVEIRVCDVATVWIDAGLLVGTVRPAHDVAEPWLGFQLERHVLPIVRMMRGEAVFHAGAVKTERGAILLLADGQGGKSTTTALLLADGAGFISDDQTGVTAACEALGTPCLRLRQPSATLVPADADTRLDGDGRIIVDLQPHPDPVPIAGLLMPGAVRVRLCETRTGRGCDRCRVVARPSVLRRSCRCRIDRTSPHRCHRPGGKPARCPPLGSERTAVATGAARDRTMARRLSLTK
jgi:hypothetical protein